MNSLTTNDKIYLIIISRMKNSWIIFGILIFIFSIFIIYSYDIYEDENNYRTHHKKQTHRNDRVRCPPKIYKKVQNENKYSINLYDNNHRVNNKGFINELMYKPNMDNNKINYSNGISVPSIELNDYTETCHEPLFGNVHYKWLLNK